MSDESSPPTARPLRVFLCHASEDKAVVRNLHRELTAVGVEVWLDEENLLPGHDWRREIGRALRSSDAVLVCLSGKSVSKAGFIQKEVRSALNLAEEQPEGAIFIIPVKLEECAAPERLQQWQAVNYYEEQGLPRLLKALQFRAAELGIDWRPAEATRPAADARPVAPRRERPAISRLIESLEEQRRDERELLLSRYEGLRGALNEFHLEMTACIRFINAEPQQAAAHATELAQQLSDFAERREALDAEYKELRRGGISMPESVLVQVVNLRLRVEELSEMVRRLQGAAGLP